VLIIIIIIIFSFMEQMLMLMLIIYKVEHVIFIRHNQLFLLVAYRD